MRHHNNPEDVWGDHVEITNADAESSDSQHAPLQHSRSSILDDSVTEPPEKEMSILHSLLVVFLL